MNSNNEKKVALLLLIPFIILVIAFLFGPLIVMIILSFQKTGGGGFSFEQYSELLLYLILIEDFTSYMYSEELMNDEYEEKLNQLLNKLDSIFTNKKPIPNGLVEQIDATLSDMGIHNSDYRPAYSVFQMIAEELNLI